MSVPRIERQTTEFPAGGSMVSVAPDVKVIRGLDFGDVSGRGIAIVAENGNVHAIKPDGVVIFQYSEKQEPIGEQIIGDKMDNI